MLGHLHESWGQGMSSTPGGFSTTDSEGAAEPRQMPRMEKWSDLTEDVDYNEQLQEDVFLGKLEIKNTFYNIPVESSMTPEEKLEKEWTSAPPNLLQRSWRTKFPEMEAAHNRGECKPCGYFLYKADGCRNGDRCPYCHLCKKGEIKRRKRMKAKGSKESTASETVPE
mmetsp:Transcript_41892/g.90817  ORF Transcript_41892/g.90817 Transcript_41892/m.90817 type:complete len:168 (+) Transcript_41892:104-607(+)